MSLFINLGCGTNKLPPPWQNYDADLDITKPLPFKDNSVDFILIEHCLEHVDGPAGLSFLTEAHRVLVRGGIIRVCVPELARLPIDQKRDIISNHGHRLVYNEDLLTEFFIAAGFDYDCISGPLTRASIDGHWRVIGAEKDENETLRMEAWKR